MRHELAESRDKTSKAEQAARSAEQQLHAQQESLRAAEGAVQALMHDREGVRRDFSALAQQFHDTIQRMGQVAGDHYVAQALEQLAGQFSEHLTAATDKWQGAPQLDAVAPGALAGQGGDGSNGKKPAQGDKNGR